MTGILVALIGYLNQPDAIKHRWVSTGLRVSMATRPGRRHRPRSPSIWQQAAAKFGQQAVDRNPRSFAAVGDSSQP